MAKRSKRQKRQQRPKKLPKEKKRTAKSTKKGNHLLRVLLGTATLLGGLSVFPLFCTRISVASSDPVDASNPYSASFKITNNSIFPLRQLNVGVGIGRLVLAGAHPPEDTRDDNQKKSTQSSKPTFDTILTYYKWEDRYLDMDETFTITPDDTIKMRQLIGVKYQEADLAIVISYKPWFSFIQYKKKFRFKTHEQTDGKLYWYSEPLN